MALDAYYEGELFLWFSLYSPSLEQEINSSSTGLSEEIEYWLVKEFLCGSDEIISVRLVQDTLLTSTCQDKSFFRGGNLRKRRRLALPSETVVLWNEPKANVTEHHLRRKGASLRYDIWNVSFPVFDWGSVNQNNPGLVQRDIQHLLEQKIWQQDLGVPIEGSRVVVQGDEEDFWMLFSSIPPSTQPPGEDIPLLPGPTTGTLRGVDPREARKLMYIGVLLIIVQTILSMLMYQYGKYFRALQQKKEDLVKERESLGQMLRSSRGFVEIDRDLDTIEQIESLEPSEPLVTKLATGELYVAASVGKRRGQDEKKRRRSSHNSNKNQKEERNSTLRSPASPSSPATKQKTRVSASRNGQDKKKKRRSSHNSIKKQKEERKSTLRSPASPLSPATKQKAQVSALSNDKKGHNSPQKHRRHSHHDSPQHHSKYNHRRHSHNDDGKKKQNSHHHKKKTLGEKPR